MSTLTPQAVAIHDDHGTTAPRAALPPTVMWDVLVSPHRWQILIEDWHAEDPVAWWAPEVQILAHRAGRGFGERKVRGADGRVRYVPDVQAGIRYWQEQGYVYVPRDYPVHAHGRDWPTFVQAYPAAGGGLHHCWAYERPRIGMPPVVDHLARCRMYAGWGLDLLGRSEPPPHVVEQIRSQHQRRLDSARSRMINTNAKSAPLRALERRMRAMGWLARENGEVRANMGSLNRESSGVGAIPLQLRQQLSTLTDAQRLALLGDSVSAPVPAPQPVEVITPTTADDEMGGEVTL